MHDLALSIRHLATRLEHLSEVLDPGDFRNLMGAVEVEVETGEEIVLERRHRLPRPERGTVVPFSRRPSTRNAEGSPP